MITFPGGGNILVGRDVKALAPSTGETGVSVETWRRGGVAKSMADRAAPAAFQLRIDRR